MPKDHCEHMLIIFGQDKQEPIILERSAILNLDPERGDKGDGVDGGDKDDRGDRTKGGEERRMRRRRRRKIVAGRRVEK